MAFIYSLTFPNQKRYIGFTRTDPSARWANHAREPIKSRRKTKLQIAIKKYGFENVIKEILIEHPDEKYTLEILEDYYIRKYDSINNGYNMIPGGTRGPVSHGEKNPTYRQRKNVPMKEWFSEEQINNHKKAMSIRHSGKGNVHARKVLLISPNGKEYVVHGELQNFCIEYNLTFSTIIECLNNDIIVVPEISSKARFPTNEQRLRRENTIGWSITPLDKNTGNGSID